MLSCFRLNAGLRTPSNSYDLLKTKESSYNISLYGSERIPFWSGDQTHAAWHYLVRVQHDLQAGFVSTALSKEFRIPPRSLGGDGQECGRADIWKPNIQSNLIGEKRSGWNKGNKKKALSYYKVIEQVGSKYSWLQLKPATGRTHQLRIHCAELGTTIVGDRKYKNNQDKNSEDLPLSSKKLFLHARSITFTHPMSKKTMNIEAELPEHMHLIWKHFGWEV